MDTETLELENKIKILEEDVEKLTTENENLKIEKEDLKEAIKLKNYELKNTIKGYKKIAETIENVYKMAYNEYKKNLP